MNDLLLCVDPGKDKTGLALLTAGGSILRLALVATDSLATALKTFLGDAVPTLCLLGNGTASKAARAELAKALPALRVELCDEAHSTEEARKLYWELNPPKGWRSVLPRGLLVPPEPVDAYAAVVLGRRRLRDGKTKK